MRNTKAVQIAFYTILGFIPLILWLLGEGQQFIFRDYYSTLTTLGKIAGIVGICLFAGNLILSGRYQFFDWLFGGLDKLYLFHRRNGITAFIFLTTHFAAMTLRTLGESLAGFIAFLADVSYAPINFGKIGYYGFLVLIIITLFVKLKYERLKFLHTFMGVFLFFGGLHVFFIPSDIASNIPLRLYILTLVAIALISWLWRTVLKLWLVPRIKAEVVEVNNLGGSVTEVVMKPNQKVNFIPGQFIFVRFKQSGFPFEDHPFSLTASTEEGRLRISAKAVGDFTKRLPELKPKSLAFIQGPFGGFSFTKSENKKQIWIAGGIGITPFMSMARTLRDRRGDPTFDGYDIHLLHSGQTEQDLVYKKELEQITSLIPGFRFHPWVTERQGYISADSIEKIISANDREIYICGPKPMMMSLKAQFVARGVPKDHIDFELFKLL